MLTLSYGYKLPQSGDKGSTLWTALQDDITRVNGHTHNGSDSAKIPVQNLTTTTQAITAAGWTLGSSAGHYSQVITMPAGFTYDNFIIDFRDASNRKVYIGVTKFDATSFTIFSIDNTLTLTAIYGV
jgi:hypothetical protein